MGKLKPSAEEVEKVLEEARKIMAEVERAHPEPADAVELVRGTGGGD